MYPYLPCTWITRKSAVFWPVRVEKHEWKRGVHYVGEDGATRSAYRRVNMVIREMQKEGFAIDPFEIKLIGPHDPMARDMLTEGGSRLARTPTRFRGNRLGELTVEEAYIYAPPVPTPKLVQ